MYSRVNSTNKLLFTGDRPSKAMRCVTLTVNTNPTTPLKPKSVKPFRLQSVLNNYTYILSKNITLLLALSAKLECKITESSIYVCTFNTQRPNTLYYTIRQMYSTTNITIGRIIDIYYAQTIVFTIKIERFDFNSAIVARLNHFKDENEDFLHDLKIAERDIGKKRYG
uniref:SFRICE_036082 n=1 Tax=Spodoptera frugiperda TaxID=7108 RepID=A0A2H1VZ20_SPOFR